jgi:hypothetical protein
MVSSNRGTAAWVQRRLQITAIGTGMLTKFTTGHTVADSVSSHVVVLSLGLTVALGLRRTRLLVLAGSADHRSGPHNERRCERNVAGDGSALLPCGRNSSSRVCRETLRCKRDEASRNRIAQVCR